MARVLAVVLAGGAGTRLQPLTLTRTKPAVPFAGSLRLIDFALNNFINSGILKIFVLTQFKSQSLIKHLNTAWHMSDITGNFIEAIPAQMRMGKRWYEGTADAIFQNLHLINLQRPDHVCIFGSDHIYKMDVAQMLKYHRRRDAAMTVAAIPVPIEDAHRFGIIEVDQHFRMTGFSEKPAKPKSIPGQPHLALASMGNYIFRIDALNQALTYDADTMESLHDFGADVIPSLFPHGEVYVYDFSRNIVPNEQHQGYWRDVGTIHSYWQAHMDILGCEPAFNLHNDLWPLRSYHPHLPPTLFRSGQVSQINNAIVSPGCVLTDVHLQNSIIGYHGHIGANTKLSEVVTLGHCEIGANCNLIRVIVDKEVRIAPNTAIGVDLQHDRARGLTVTDDGIVVIPKGAKVGN